MAGLELLILFEVAFLSVAESQSDSDGHEPHRREQKDNDAFADGPLALFGSCSGSAVAHRAGLAESRTGREKKRGNEDDGAKLHFTPRERMRSASGKKIIISAKHTTREAMVSHFIRETSNFMCMK